MFVKRLADAPDKVRCIPESEEKYITFNKNLLVDTIVRNDKEVKIYTRLKFLHTFRFMSTSLGKLVKNIDKFEHTSKYFKAEQQELLRRKEVCPYDHMTKFAETELLPKEAFDTRLDFGAVSCSSEFDEMRPKEISDQDYEHAKKVWNALECENLRDYKEAYCKIDTLQLADVMENFIDVCHEKYKLDPSHYIMSAALGMDAMLKVTGVEIELLTDPDMYLFFKEGIRGGVSSAMKRYSKANNKYMKDYGPEGISEYITYLDENALYTSALCKPLPLRGFRWLTQEEIFEMTNDHSKIRSCTLRVDLEYPEELHDLHNDYTLAVESLTVNGVKKLIPNLRNKEKYVVHNEALKCYLKCGMKLKKIHGGISFEERDYMKKFIEINKESRKVLKKEFEKDFYKLMSNSVYGKTMENVTRRENIKILNGLDEVKR